MKKIAICFICLISLGACGSPSNEADLKTNDLEVSFVDPESVEKQIGLLELKQTSDFSLRAFDIKNHADHRTLGSINEGDFKTPEDRATRTWWIYTIKDKPIHAVNTTRFDINLSMITDDEHITAMQHCVEYYLDFYVPEGQSNFLYEVVVTQLLSDDKCQ